MPSRLTTALLPDGVVLTSILAKLPNLMAVYLFGSHAKQSTHSESDLDLALLTFGYIEPNQLWSLANDLASLINCDVDLVDLRAASTVMQHQVISTGQSLWDIGMPARLFEVAILSEKLALDEAREPLLRAITQEGHVYAR